MKGAGFKIGLSSASKSARMVLNSTHLTSFFDVIIDGHSTRKSKPDPECFLMASRELALPTRCVVFEDSHLGVQAGLFGDFTVIGVGSSDYLTNAHAVIPNFENLSIKNMLGILADTPVISS
ncbi:MAG: HAD-IA family hydrolase [Saprospiraceae bacterium]